MLLILLLTKESLEGLLILLILIHLLKEEGLVCLILLKEEGLGGFFF